MPADPRYQLERVESDDQGLAQLQENLQRVFETMSSDTDDNQSAAISAAAGTGTSYSPAVAANWASPAPTTVSEALDRLVAAVGGTP